MALVTGPLHSFEAHGQIGKALIYEEWNGRYYVKTYAAPALRRVPAQRAVRAINRFLTDQWENTLTSEKASWDNLAVLRNTSRIAEYCRENFARFWTGRGPTKSWPTTGPTSSGVWADFTATGGVGIVTISTDWHYTTEGWGAMFYARPSAGTPNPKQIVGIFVPGTHLSPLEFTIENVEPGTYQYYGCTFSTDGLKSATIIGPDEAIVS